MVKLRIRCQVLKIIAAMDSGTANDVFEYVNNELTPAQVQRALEHLCEDDEIRKIDTKPRNNMSGRPWNIYKVRDEGFPQVKKKRYRKKGRKNHSETLRAPMKYDEERNIWVIKYRDRKIKLLRSFLPTLQDMQKDLLLGIIADYEKG